MIELNDLSRNLYSVNENIRFKTDSCNYSDTSIAVERRTTVEGDNDDKTRNKKLIFKNNIPFRSCVSKISNTFVYNKEHLDIVMPKYNLLEYSSNYFITLWNFVKLLQRWNNWWWEWNW